MWLMNGSYLNKSSTVWGPLYTEGPGQTAPVAPPPSPPWWYHYLVLSQRVFTSENSKFTVPLLKVQKYLTFIAKSLASNEVQICCTNHKKGLKYLDILSRGCSVYNSKVTVACPQLHLANLWWCFNDTGITLIWHETKLKFQTSE